MIERINKLIRALFDNNETSISEVAMPGIDDLLMMSMNQSQRLKQHLRFVNFQ